MKGCNIFLSPHLDDICFSLVCTVHAVGGGTLINLFSRSRYVAEPYEPILASFEQEAPQTPESKLEKSEIVSQVRRREDEAFCQRVGLERLDLGLDDADLRSHDPFSSSDADRAIDADQVSQVLMPALENLLEANRSQSITMFCPMGIGGHRDHLACLQAILQLPLNLRQQVQLLFYEDLHYSSNEEARRLGLQRFLQLASPGGWRKLPMRLTPTNMNWKMELIHLYNSQHYHPLSIWDYTPADSSHWGAHEAVWVETSTKQFS